MKYMHIIGAAIVALLGGAAAAQDARHLGEEPASRAAQPAAVVPTVFTACKGSDVLRAKVRNQTGEVGKIEDLIVDPSSGRIEYAVLAMSGDHAKGDQWHAIPFGLFTTPTLDDEMANERGNSKPDFHLNLDAARLQNAPGFAKDKWPDVNAPAWRAELDEHYGGTRSGDVARGADATQAGRRSVRASDLMGKDLHTAADDEIGAIDELVIDTRGARIPYVVVSSGGFLGLGDELHAIPWQAIRVRHDAGQDRDKDRLIVDVEKDRVLKAPEFKKDDWGRMSDRAWVSDLYTYYGFKPYWSSTVDAGLGEGRKPIDRKEERPAPDGKDQR